MIKKLKFRTDQGSNLFMCSDLHLGHDRDFIYKPRGFGNVEDCKNWIIDSINERVGKNDVLFSLGDFALNSTPEDVEYYLQMINCENIYYVWGNHEGPTLSLYKKWVTQLSGLEDVEIYPFKYKNVTFVGRSVEVSINKKDISLSHFAPLIWNKSHYGTYAIFGHSHGSLEHGLPSYKNGLRLDVGVEVCREYNGSAVMSWDEIQAVMNTKHKEVIDHHNENTN